MMRVAINGFGRIGRSVYRLLAQRDDIEVAVVNDIAKPEALAYLLQYDTVMGNFPGEVEFRDGYIFAGKQSPKLTAIRNLAELPWKDERVDVVVIAPARPGIHLQVGVDGGLVQVG